ncbi:Virginiamycin B lyase [Methylobacterium adhaesivum]|nr:Virginiamycin B lyase [Methylobacterium adhaesivum]
MMHRHAVDRAKPLWSALRVSVVFTLLGLPAIASDRPDTIRLPDTGRFPENVTSAANGTLFVSSIADGGVLRIDGGGAVATAFLKPGDHGTPSTFGLLVDERRGTLWVASNDATAIGAKGPTGTEGGWVKAFDLATGALKQSVRLAGEKTLANDLVLDAQGALYVTNTFAPQILRLKPSAAEFDVFVEDEALKKGLDGIAFGADGNLYVNTFLGAELFRIDVRDGTAGAVTKLETTRPMTFPDGLRAFRDGFLMVEGSGALSRVTVSGDRARLDPIGQFAGPTGVTVAGDRIWVAEGQLGLLSKVAKDGREAPSFHLRSVNVD